MKIYKNLYLIMIIVFLASCKREVKKYYDNGNLKEHYYTEGGKINGVYKKYFESDRVKEVHVFDKGVKVDSSIYYRNDSSKSIEKIVYHRNDSLKYFKRFAPIKNQLLSEGLGIDNETRLGIWKFYSTNDSIVEYKNINSSTYVNQFWVISKSKDTLGYKSNFFKLFSNDSVKSGDTFRLRLELTEPFYSYDSDIEVIIPVDDSMLKDDFSNLFQIEHNTLLSLKNDGIPHPEIPKDFPTNHLIEFGLSFKEKGKRRIRGVLIEYQTKKVEEKPKKIERRLFFETDVIVY